MITFKPVDTWDDGKRIHVSGTLEPSGEYKAHGDDLDLSNVASLKAAIKPLQGTAWVDGLAGYDYVFHAANGDRGARIKIFCHPATAGPFPELDAGYYPDAIRNDTITFYGIFAKEGAEMWWATF